ncbi:uncharacterized protein LOC119556247 [Drosophila subpulchrella]|uniref:uncharacterized protein LOC119556247 n=1 Tax=Drosophila subpulchrella TaxID=1486046 RepID=UPI0018A142E6|nr:uncharacterized protein LOC119556247 [Drosophila subpulchrella]
MEVFAENIRKIPVQDQNIVDLQNVTSNVKNLGLASEVKNLTEIQGDKLPHNMLSIEDHKILSESQSLEHLNYVQKVEDYFSVQSPEKFSLEIENVKQQSATCSLEKDPYQKQELDDKTQDAERQSPSRNLDDTASERIVNRRSRVIPPMPSEDAMRHSIADNLMEILVNMTNPLYRQQCFELLQVGDALQARSRILDILQQIDKRRIRR